MSNEHVTDIFKVKNFSSWVFGDFLQWVPFTFFHAIFSNTPCEFKTWIVDLALAFCRHVLLSKSFNFSEPHFLHLWGRDKTSCPVHFPRVLGIRCNDVCRIALWIAKHQYKCKRLFLFFILLIIFCFWMDTELLFSTSCFLSVFSAELWNDQQKWTVWSGWIVGVRISLVSG